MVRVFRMSDEMSHENSKMIAAICSGDVGLVRAIIEAGSPNYLMKCGCLEFSRTLLHHAVMHGYAEIVSMLLKIKADVNARDEAYVPPLHYAVRRNSLEIVKLLLEKNATVDAPLKNGTTALYHAVKYGHLEIAKELLNNGARVDVSGRKRQTPLHYAAMQGNESMVKLLLSKGANINAETRENETPLYFATDMKQETMVRLLLERGADINCLARNRKSILHLAIERLQLQSIEHILEHHPTIYFTNLKLLNAAVERGYKKIVQALLSRGTDVNAQLHPPENERTPLQTAILYGHFEIAVLLLRFGANPKAKDRNGDLAIDYAIESNDASITKLLVAKGGVGKSGKTAKRLVVAVRKKNPEIVEMLLNTHDPEFNINAKDHSGMTFLHHTVSRDADEFLRYVASGKKRGAPSGESVEATAAIARMLISRGAAVDAKMRNGMTTLHLALEVGYSKVVEALLANDANVNAGLEKTGATPLHAAVKWNNLPLIKMLFDAGADVDSAQHDGTTAIHIASEIGHSDVIKLLVEQNGNLNAERHDKAVPLHLAAAKGSRNAVETLLELGANIEAKDNLGKTALHIAAEFQCLTVVEVLLDQGADVNVTCNESLTPHDYADLETSESRNDDSRSLGPRFKYNEDDVYFEHNPYQADYDGVKSRRACDDVAEYLEQHIIAITALDMHVSEKNLRAIDGYDKRSEVLEHCQNEIADMKTKKIDGVSFYQLLKEDINTLARYATYENIARLLQSKNLNDRFPTYSKMITLRIRLGLKRSNLLNSGYHSLSALFNSLPDISATNVVENLNNDNLQNLIDASATILITIFGALSLNGNSHPDNSL